MDTINIQYFESPVGELILGSFGDRLCMCDWKYRKQRNMIDSRLQKNLAADYRELESEVILKTISQLKEYFEKSRTIFDIPLLLVGTDFQKSVWNALLQVEYGTTETYMQLAKRLNKQEAIRAVSSANGANSISIIVPCHRIIGSNGDLVGYAGGLDAKKKLLYLENESNQLDLF